jgi:uncharacterized protein
MKYNKIIDNALLLVEKETSSNVYGHDFWHILRVYRLACYINQFEKGDLLVVSIAAIFHDFYDDKFNDISQKEKNRACLKKFLSDENVSNEVIEKIFTIINEVHFKGSHVDDSVSSLEAMIVQDADRLDALGAIGIARAFACGAYFQQNIHVPDVKPTEHFSYQEYQDKRTTTINHFYEKLLLIKDKMKTGVGKKLAEERHIFMVNYLKQFFDEWSFCPSACK